MVARTHTALAEKDVDNTKLAAAMAAIQELPEADDLALFANVAVQKLEKLIALKASIAQAVSLAPAQALGSWLRAEQKLFADVAKNMSLRRGILCHRR